MSDVVAIDRSHSTSDVDVGSCGDGGIQFGPHLGWVDGTAVLLGVVGVASTTQQLRSGDRGDEFGDSVGVGIVDDDEVLRSGAMEAGEDVGFGIGHRFGRQWDAVLVAFFDPGCLVGGDVEAGFVAGPGEGDVGAFAVEAGGADDEHGVAGDALGLVDRDGVGVVDPAVVEVVAVEHDVFAAGDADGHVVGGEVGDGAAHAVVDGELLAGHEVLVAVVAAHHDLVADDVAVAGELDLVVEGQLTGCGEHLAGVAVEEAGFGACPGEQQRFSVGAGGVPVAEHDRVEVVGCVGDDDSAVVSVCGERGRNVTAAELIERLTFPLVLLAAVDGQLNDLIAECVERGAERSTGGDFGQLVMVADEHDLGADGGCLVDDRSDVTGAGHRRLVHDDNGGRGDGSLFDEVPGDRRRLDARPLLKLAGSPC